MTSFEEALNAQDQLKCHSGNWLFHCSVCLENRLTNRCSDCFGEFTCLFNTHLINGNTIVGLEVIDHKVSLSLTCDSSECNSHGALFP